MLNSNLKEKYGYIRQLTAADDMNDIVQNGIYFYTTQSFPTNAPFQNASVVEVYGSNSQTTQKIQRVTRYGTSGNMAFRPLSAGKWLDWDFCAVKTDYTVYNIACSYGPSINLFKFGNDAIKAIKVQGYLNQQLLSTQKYTLATNDNLKSKVNWYKNVLIGTGGKDTIGYLEISSNGDLNLKPAVNLASGTGIHFMEYYV